MKIIHKLVSNTCQIPKRQKHTAPTHVLLCPPMMFWARFKIQHLWVWGILPSHVLKTAAQGKGHSRVPDYLFLWDSGAALTGQQTY